ncbi:MAG: M23 family metallopeptidase [Actinomycetales bacterium]|nr:M23 family metallopeptidase [Actinomycetales bacterium]
MLPDAGPLPGRERLPVARRQGSSGAPGPPTARPRVPGPAAPPPAGRVGAAAGPRRREARSVRPALVRLCAPLLAAGLAALPAAPEPPADASGAPSPAYGLPVAGPVARFFDPPPAPWAAGHRGVDLAAAAGTPVLAPADGTVLFSGRVVDRVVVTVGHPDGLRSSLEPLEDPLPVGAVVRAGEVVGRLAATAGHCAPATCLHWGARRGDAYVDPLDLLGRAPVVLLPDRPRPAADARGAVSTCRSPAAWSAAAASRPCASGRSATP